MYTRTHGNTRTLNHSTTQPLERPSNHSITPRATLYTDIPTWAKRTQRNMVFRPCPRPVFRPGSSNPNSISPIATNPRSVPVPVPASQAVPVTMRSQCHNHASKGTARRTSARVSVPSRAGAPGLRTRGTCVPDRGPVLSGTRGAGHRVRATCPAKESTRTAGQRRFFGFFRLRFFARVPHGGAKRKSVVLL
ncbi:hypothetical protein HG535_0A05470 [Zygotorulaspora mrakii]|uniref:Uncharacterized protein n=1 Tax=Zygotorulaspora mrakii TaxID=42260 RepID=A0A7H9AWD4_ZYGMR|nr:uncharacterized protein HG535_0A05470 [Zygotorulaspora mrakii]QLG70606.1 hypothetical protein HG535_0A05470 [Zygotorulaspora mrakii]